MFNIVDELGITFGKVRQAVLPNSAVHETEAEDSLRRLYGQAAHHARDSFTQRVHSAPDSTLVLEFKMLCAQNKHVQAAKRHREDEEGEQMETAEEAESDEDTSPDEAVEGDQEA
jgi:hypothetical protein